MKLTFIVFLVLFIALFGLYVYENNKNSNLRAELQRVENNMNALNDTITETRNRNGDLEYEKSTLIASKDELKTLNAELYSEIQAEKGKVAQLNKIIAVISSPKPTPISTNVTSTGNPCDSTGQLVAEWQTEQRFNANNYRKLRAKTDITLSKGNVASATTTILEDEMGLDLVTGLVKRDDHYEIFVRSGYPGFKPTKIDGAIIPQKDLLPPPVKKTWSVGFGPQVGIGAHRTNANADYTVGAYFGIGLSLQYTLIRF